MPQEEREKFLAAVRHWLESFDGEIPGGYRDEHEAAVIVQVWATGILANWIADAQAIVSEFTEE